MADAEEGETTAMEDFRSWSALSPTRGQVLEVYLPSTDIQDPRDEWAAFLILQVSNRLDGSVVLTVFHLGCPDKALGKKLDVRFNLTDCGIHLCLSSPCVDTGVEGNSLPDTYLHATKVRLWTFGGFAAVQDYISAARMKEAEKKLKPARAAPPAGPRRARKGADGPGKPPKGKAAKAAAVPKRAAADPKLTPADREALGEKLRQTRKRLQEGDANPKKKRPRERERPESISDEELSRGYSPEVPTLQRTSWIWKLEQSFPRWKSWL